MAYSKEQIQQLFQSQFDQSVWTDFIINFFKAQTLRRVPEPLDIDQSEGHGYYWGKLSTNDDYEISFFYLKMKRSVDQRKVGLRQLINRYIKIDSDAGIAVFDDGKHWRLSFITDMRGEKTSPKRYTFVFGDKDKVYNTAVSRFLELQKAGISFKNIKEAFSVEALTKQFYNDLFDWYTWALDPTTGVYFPNNPNTNADDTKQLDTKLIRLITRLMFVWFIKQKGLVPANLFDPEEIKLYLVDFDKDSMEQGNYYQAILQNLFFATLNRPIKNITYDKDGNKIEERRCFATNKDKPDVKSKYRYTELFKISEDQILKLFEFIPFINGGLFECLDKNKTSDGVEQAYYDDGFSRSETMRDGHFTRRAFVPNKLFFDPENGIISIFNRYNFTVEENSPSEQQIALDPELLGKVFENLLGVYNPETHDTARNESGSFYTPREIVNYMVDISLQSYLGNTDETKALFAEDFEYDEAKKDFYNEIINKLQTIKVLDPACGSGAFPIGMLNRIVELLQNLKATGSKYDLKLQIMENCIYGGDIQTIAAQITKLRFFISLVCDCEKTNSADDNYGIPNLPNLETHFVTCNSLIGFKKPQQYSLFEQDVIALKEKLREVRHEHFIAKTVYQKTKLRDRDKELRDELTRMLSDDNVIASEDAAQMVAWNPYDQNGKASFFDPEWMFGIKDGFDIVIGNPPYIQLQENEGALADLYFPCGFSSFDRRGDIYELFYEKGNAFLKSGGNLCFITSNGWMKSGYGDNLRVYLANNTNPTLLIDFNKMLLFESAVVETNILLFRKENNGYHCKACSFLGRDKQSVLGNLLQCVNEEATDCKFTDVGSWIIVEHSEQSVKSKIEFSGTMIKYLPLTIYRGITTGCNDGFIIDGNTRSAIYSKASAGERVILDKTIFPILQGRNLKKYSYSFGDKYMIVTPRGYDISQVPTLKAHMLTHYSALSNKSGSNEWYELQASPSETMLRNMHKEKIMWGEISDQAKFTFDEGNFFAEATTFFMTTDDKEVSLKYLLAVLNSSPAVWYFHKIATTTGMGTNRWKKYKLELLPVVKVDKTLSQPIVKLVDQILKEKKKDTQADTTTLERKIDIYIYLLYGLDYDEVMVVENTLPQEDRLNLNKASYTQWLKKRSTVLPTEQDLEQMVR